MKKRKVDNRFIVTLFSGLTFLLLAVSACSKTKGSSSSSDDDHHNNGGGDQDTTYPVIRIDKPLADQVFTSGDTVIIDALISDNALYRGKIRITNDLNNLLVDEKGVETHFFTSYNFVYKHKCSVAVPSNYTVTMEYEDHGFNVSTKTRKIKINP